MNRFIADRTAPPDGRSGTSHQPPAGGRTLGDHVPDEVAVLVYHTDDLATRSSPMAKTRGIY
jgi:hypothetical protein